MKRILVLALLSIPAISFAKDAAPVAPAAVVAPASAPASAPAPHDAAVTAPSSPSKVNITVGKVVVTKDAEPTTVVDVGTLIKEVVIAFKTGKHWYGVSILLMLLTFAIGLIKKSIPANVLPWIAASIGVATNIVGAIVGGTVWWESAISGLFQGAAAAGLWSLIGKHILMSPDMKTKRANARLAVNGESVSGSIEEK